MLPKLVATPRKLFAIGVSTPAYDLRDQGLFVKEDKGSR